MLPRHHPLWATVCRTAARGQVAGLWKQLPLPGALDGHNCFSSPPGYSSLCQWPACVPAAFLEGPCFKKAERSWHVDTRQDYRGAWLCCVHFHFDAASPRRRSLSEEDAAHWAIQSKEWENRFIKNTREKKTMRLGGCCLGWEYFSGLQEK